MAKRKTINVELVKNKANILLANPNLIMEEKLGVITMIEMILLESDNYNGFMYLKLTSENEAPRLGTPEWTERKYF
jgi:hypothetical protein